MSAGVFWIMSVGIVAAMAGFWTGRLSLLGSIVAGQNEGDHEGGQNEPEDNIVKSGMSKSRMSENRALKKEKSKNGIFESKKSENGILEREESKNKIVENKKSENRMLEIRASKSKAAESDTPESSTPESKRSGNRVSEGRILEGKNRTGGMLESRVSESKRSDNRIAERRKIWRKPADRGISGRRQNGNERRIPLGWAIGSPAEGRVSTYSEGSRRGAMVQDTHEASSSGFLYAPASGKITKLYPLGNQMILRTDFGVELLIRVGNNTDEFLGEYFRPRILQNEFVNKGKLLLEYDREGIISEGGNADISVSVTAAEDFDNITVTDREQVKAGEEILWVRDWAGVV